MGPTTFTSTIFISYRRQDSQDFADRLYDALAGQLGHERVFMDIDSIGYGDNFEVTLERNLESCTAMLVLIGPGWLTAQDGDGHRRLDNPDDFVRREIEAGLERQDVRVIPILAHGSVMPTAEELPTPLAPLALRQALSLSREYFRQGIEKLLEALEPPGAPGEARAAMPDLRPRAEAVVKRVSEALRRLEAGQADGDAEPEAAETVKIARVAPWYRDPTFKSIATIVLLYVFFPAGLAMMWRATDWPLKTKQIVTVVVAVVVVVVLIVTR